VGGSLKGQIKYLWAETRKMGRDVTLQQMLIFNTSVGRLCPWASRKAEKLSPRFSNNPRDSQRGKATPGGHCLVEAYSLTKSIFRSDPALITINQISA